MLAPPSPVQGYVLAAGLALGMAVCNGFARFAYALILPAMRADLAWSYTEAGALNTANAVGYLLGSVLSLATIRRMGARGSFLASLWITSVAVAAMATTRDFVLLGILRVIAGTSGASVFITGSVLAASVFPTRPDAAARAIAIYFGGGGLGLLVSAVSIPWLLAVRGDAAWPLAWWLLGALCAAGSLLATLAALRVTAPAAARRPVPWAKGPLLASFLAYALFALGYTAYTTFIVAFMRANGAGAGDIATMWAALGVAALVGPQVWGGAIVRWRGGNALAAVLATIAVGATLPLLSAHVAVMSISAALFGFFFMTPASITALIKRALPPVVWGEAVAAFTLLFAALQCVGPVLTGYLADVSGSLADGLSVSAAILFAGAAIAFLQQEMHPSPPHATNSPT